MLISRTPFRISFVGGGSDLPAYCERRTGAVLSVTIDKAMFLTLHPYFDQDKVLLRYSRTELVDSADSVEHPIYREAMKLQDVIRGVEISSTADVPAGTGLGSSSSFTVGLLHVLAAYKSQYVSREQLAAMASHIEIDLLGQPIGRQDQYAAAYGGLNVIEFSGDGRVRVEPVTISQQSRDTLESGLLMFYTGTQRDTSSILSDQSAGVASDDAKFEATSRMVELVYQMRDALHRDDFEAFGALLHKNWMIKRELSSHVSNTLIDGYYEAALEAGALGGKLLGAGGGGFLLVFAPPQRHAAIRQALAELHELPVRFSMSGSSIIYTDGTDMSTGQGLLGRARQDLGK